MRKFWKAATLALGVAVLPMLAAPAGAVTGFPIAGYGFDGQAHIIVGGGSDTTYAAMLAISQLYMKSSLSSCGPLHQAGGAGAGANTNLNECTSNTDNDKNLGNYDGDTVAQANAVGSTGGKRSLNGFGETGTDHTFYEGTANPVGAGYDPSCINQTTKPNVDFARSSSGPTTSGSSAVNPTCGGTANDLAADTYWGFARDGITWIAFNNRATQIRALAGAGALAPSDIRKMYDCTYKRWSDVPGLGITLNGPGDGPIVPWTMNDASGTRSVGLNFLINQGGAPAGFNPDLQTANGGPCVQYLGGAANSTGQADVAHKPLENDIKQLVNNHGANGTGLSTDPNSRDNPENWIWWGSFGVFNAFPYTSKISSLGGPVASVSAGFLPVAGIIPSATRVFADTLGAGLGRTLNHVTRKADADCPHSTPGDGICNFGIAGPPLPGGGNDLNVTGGASGIAGAVREFTRFICRPTTSQHGNDPLTGVNNFTELSTAITAAGFQTLNGSLVSAGSRCAVQSS